MRDPGGVQSCGRTAEREPLRVDENERQCAGRARLRDEHDACDYDICDAHSGPGAVPPGRRTANGMTDQEIAGRARALAEALAEAGFARLRVRDGDLEIEVRRSAHAAAAAAPAPAEDERRIEAPDEVIASDVVGIVHLLRPPLVEGQEFDADRDLAYVETLGIRNPVRSRGAGRIRSVLVGEGEPVEYGQPLFTVER